jgi:hypothetical protein
MQSASQIEVEACKGKASFPDAPELSRCYMGPGRSKRPSFSFGVFLASSRFLLFVPGCPSPLIFQSSLSFGFQLALPLSRRRMEDQDRLLDAEAQEHSPGPGECLDPCLEMMGSFDHLRPKRRYDLVNLLVF